MTIASFEKVDLNWEDYVTTSSEFSKPVSTGNLCADISKLKNNLNIEPQVQIDDLISIMLDHDLSNC